MKLKLFCGLFLLGIAFTARGESPPQLLAKRMHHAPQIDGIVNPSEWSEADHVSGFIDAVTGKLAKEQSEAWIGFDDEAIYVAIRAYDSHPEQIIGREITPEANFNGEDVVNFYLNAFGTRSYTGASHFSVNVLNTQSENISGGHSSKREWRGEWTSAVKRLADGYSVEMRIPWRILDYPHRHRMSMDINFERVVGRTNEGSRWANTTIKGNPDQTGIWKDVEPPEKKRTERPEVLTYVAADFDVKERIRTGIDVRGALTPVLKGLLSVSPDFKNIEQQIAGIEFTRTERFLNEARPFFTEGGDFFQISDDFGLGSMFYSRRITNFDFAGKAFGQLDPLTEVGALTTVQLGSETASVVRIKRSFGPKANIYLYTVQDGLSTGTDQSFGGSGFYSRGSFQAGTNIAGDRQPGDRLQSAGDVYLNYSVPHWFSSINRSWIEPNFNPNLGYIPWTDRRGLFWYSEFNSEFRKGPIKDTDANFFIQDNSTYTDDLQQKGGNLYANCTLRNDTRIGLNFEQTRYQNGLDRIWSGELKLNASNRFHQIGLNWETGIRADNPDSFVAINVSQRVKRGLDVSIARSALNNQGLDDLTILTVGFQPSPARSLTGRYVSRNGKSNAYASFRNAGLSGTELYLIVGDPNADTTQVRLSMKVVKALCRRQPHFGGSVCSDTWLDQHRGWLDRERSDCE